MNRATLYLKLKTAFIYFLIAFSLFVNVLAPILAWQWKQLPFPGLLFEHTLVISDVYNPAWPARQVGLRNPDRLTAINGTPVANSRDLVAVLSNFSPGERVTLRVERIDPPATLEVTVPILTLSNSDFFIVFGIPYLIGLAYLALGLFVYRLRASERAGEVFAVFCALFGIVSGSMFDLYSYHYLTFAWTGALPFLAASLVHLALVFPIETKLIKKYPSLRFAPYLPAAVLSLVGVASLYSANPIAYFLPWRLEFGFTSLNAIVFFGLVLYIWYINFSPLVRQQARIIFWGSLAAFTPITLWMGIAILGHNIPFSSLVYTFVFAPLVLFPMSIAYAILRYQLLELDKVARQVLLYIGLSAVALAGFGVMVVLLKSLLGIPAPWANPAVLMIYGLGLVIFLGPLRDWLATVITRLFFSSSHNFQNILQEYTRRLATIPLEVDEILDLYLDHVGQGIESRRRFIFLLDAKGTTYEMRFGRQYQHSEDVTISYLATDSLPEWLGTKKEALLLNAEGHPVRRVPVDREEIARLAMLGVQVVVPLPGVDRLLGWLAMGMKVSGAPYTQTDLTFLENLSNQTTIALENAQLVEMANRKTQELMALQETNLDIASTQDTDRILTSVVERAVNLLKARGGSIYLLDEVANRLNNTICYNLDADYASLSLKPGQGIAGKVAQTGKPLLVGNYRSLPEQITIHPGDNFGPVVALPLRWQGEVRGVLELIREARAPHFSEEDLHLLQVLAGQAAIALENARLLNEAQIKATQLGTLHEVNRIISATLDREKALRLVMEKAVEILQTEAGSVFLVDESGKNLIFEVALGPTGMQLVGAKIAMDTHSIAGSIAVSQEPLIVNNVAKDPRWNTRFDEATDFHTRDILGVPMIAFNRVVGVIEVINKLDGSPFTAEDLNTLTIFSAQAAIAIVNAERFTQTDQALTNRVRELNTLELIDRELNATLDLKAVLRLTLSSMLDFVGASVGLIALTDEERSGLYFQHMVGIAPEYQKYSQQPWPPDKGIIGRTFTTGRAMVAEEGQIDNFASYGRSTAQLCLPIILKEEVIGVISLERADGVPFAAEDRAFAMRLASHASLAIQNARLFEAVKAANQAKTEFMSVASHELKIPMTSIKGYARMLEMIGGDNLSDQQKEFLKIITANTDRMDRLVSDLLDVSRIEAGRIKLEMENVSIKEVIEEVVRSVATQIADKGLAVTVDVSPDLPPIWADYGRMVQVMTNLISNAYKYTPEGGSITIRAHTVEGEDNHHRLAVSVSDTGYGISEEDQQRLFTKFFRSPDQKVREVRGTGLGLAITKSLIEMHGGAMWFESTLGEGSTFGFTLPLKQPQPEKTPA